MSIRTVRSKLPGEFVEELYRAFPIHTADRILAGFAKRRPVTLRANTLKTSVSEVIKELGRARIKCQRVPWYADALVIKGSRENDLQSLELYQEGKIYLQSLSSMVPPLVLAPQPGEAVLDIAAAPGSKTTQMAAMMGNEGRIVAAEIDRVRAQRLSFNIERQGVTIAEVVAQDGVSVADSYPESFDRVLVDAPCSGEGLFLIDQPATYSPWSPKLRRRSVASQRRLLDAGLRALKPSGVLVYSTCTLNPEENELVLDDLLKRREGQIRIAPISLDVPGWSPALGEFKGRTFGQDISHARRILPSASMEGFFVARIEKSG